MMVTGWSPAGATRAGLKGIALEKEEDGSTIQESTRMVKKHRVRMCREGNTSNHIYQGVRNSRASPTVKREPVMRIRSSLLA
jgi:hypothetical protein